MEFIFFQAQKKKKVRAVVCLHWLFFVSWEYLGADVFFVENVQVDLAKDEHLRLKVIYSSSNIKLIVL